MKGYNKGRKEDEDMWQRYAISLERHIGIKEDVTRDFKVLQFKKKEKEDVNR
jgi:hypothetical protein